MSDQFMPEMDDYESQEAAQHADLCALQQSAWEAIEKARRGPITEDEAALLRWACGLAR